MKISHVCVLVSALALVWSCSDDTASTPNPPPGSGAQSAATDGGVGASSGESDSGAAAGVECTHPGAGKPLGNDRCECTTSLSVAGEWTTKRTCREGDACPTKDKEELVAITQDGTNIQLDRGDSYSVKGTLCGTIAVWNGGPKDGFNPECGQLRFSDDAHFLSDSCFVASGECNRTHAQGCPSQKGQCTGTGVKMPDPPVNIQKVICN